MSVSSLDVSFVRSTTETLRGCPWLAWPVDFWGRERSAGVWNKEAIYISNAVLLLWQMDM
jgi:hypothetical protein